MNKPTTTETLTTTATAAGLARRALPLAVKTRVHAGIILCRSQGGLIICRPQALIVCRSNG